MGVSWKGGSGSRGAENSAPRVPPMELEYWRVRRRKGMQNRNWNMRPARRTWNLGFGRSGWLGRGRRRDCSHISQSRLRINALVPLGVYTWDLGQHLGIRTSGSGLE